MSELLKIDLFDAEEVIAQMVQLGAVSLPLLTENGRQALLEQAEKVGSFPTGPVRPLGVFGDLKSNLEDLINGPMRESPKRPLVDEFHFNLFSINKFLPGGSLGRHIDPDERGVQCICVAEGEGKFFVSTMNPYQSYGDREFKLEQEQFKKTKREIKAGPGSVIFMRAPGFMGIPLPVSHEVSEVTKTRYSLVFRDHDDEPMRRRIESYWRTVKA